MPFSPVGEAEVVQIRRVRRLLLVSIHLVVNRNTPPLTRSRTGRIVSVYVSGHSIQGNRLKQQPVVRFSLYMYGHMIPGIVDGIAGNAGRHPPVVDVVPDIPL